MKQRLTLPVPSFDLEENITALNQTAHTLSNSTFISFIDVYFLDMYNPFPPTYAYLVALCVQLLYCKMQRVIMPSPYI